MIRSVIFDIDDTMFDYGYADKAGMSALLRYTSEQLSLDLEMVRARIAQVQSRITGRLGTDDSAIHNRLIRFQTLLEELGVPDFTHALKMYHAYWDTFIDAVIPEPGFRELVTALRKAGISIGVGTDMTAYIQYKKLEKLDVLREMSFIVTSEEAGVEKPSSPFFRLCVEKAGCAPEESVFIGDNMRKDVEGACSAGLHGMWYHPTRLEKENEESSGYPVIRSYEECLKDGRICMGEMVRSNE